MAITELRSSRRYVGTDEHDFITVRDCICLLSELDAAEAAIWTATDTFNEHTTYPLKVEVVPKPKAWPGYSWFRVTLGPQYNPSRYPIGKATMEIRSNSQRRRLKKDLTSPTKLPIEGPGNGAAGVDEIWKITRGTNVVPEPSTIVIVKTAYTQASLVWATLIADIGKVNAAQTSNILNAAAGTLMLWDIRIPKWFLYRDDVTLASNVPIEYVFYYLPEGWNAQLAVQRYHRRAVSLPVYATNEDTYAASPNFVKRDDPTDVTPTVALAQRRTVIRTVIDVTDAEKTDRVLAETFDASTLNGYLSWSVQP